MSVIGVRLAQQERVITTLEVTLMYEAPKLEKFGTFRELTLQTGKNVVGQDITPGWGGGMDCQLRISCRS